MAKPPQLIDKVLAAGEADSVPRITWERRSALAVMAGIAERREISRKQLVNPVDGVISNAGQHLT
jgi:hypothetical protein